MPTIATIRVYVSDLFLEDWTARWDLESEAERGVYSDAENAAILSLGQKIDAAPQAKRGRGTGVWLDLDEAEARHLRGEAKYRAEYWLTDAYGVEDIQPYERTAGRAAKRLLESLDQQLNVTQPPPKNDVPQGLAELLQF